jgi:transposase-like protein
MQTKTQDQLGAAEKCRAVLAVWTERKQASNLCRELGVSASLFSQWQDRALLGMLEALEPRGTKEADAGPALPAQIRRLLDRKARTRDLQAVGRTVLSSRRPERTKPLPVEAAPAVGR